jgi:putative Holliday junction resolvase
MLGIDVGEKRIGVAVNQGRVAVPLAIINHTNREDDIARVTQVARDEAATAIVVGLPLMMSGEEHEQARISRRFGERLARATKLPIVYSDERLSSADVHAARSAHGNKRREHVDDLAAAVILQRYIDAQEHAG